MPSWRLDLEREIDLIEEVARVYGYNRFANTLPTFSGIVMELPHAAQRSSRSPSSSSAWVGTRLYPALSALLPKRLHSHRSPTWPYALGNPLSEEAGMLRPSLLPGMLTMLAHNLNRNVSDVRLFENGTVFSGSPERVDERPRSALGATGSLWSGPELPRTPSTSTISRAPSKRSLAKFAHALLLLRHLRRRQRHHPRMAPSRTLLPAPSPMA